MSKPEGTELRELPVPDRLQLAQAQWGSLENEWASLPVTDRERRLLDESLRAYYQDPDAGTPWPEAKAELLKSL